MKKILNCFDVFALCHFTRQYQLRFSSGSRRYILNVLQYLVRVFFVATSSGYGDNQS